MIDFSNMRLLILSPHPDDETLGCGGLISKIKKAGGEVYVMIITYGDEAQYGGFSEKNTRLMELENVMGFLKVDDFEVLLAGEEYHLMLDQIPEKVLLDKIEKDARLNLNKLKPNVVALPASGSYNVDHIATYQAGFTALRPRPHNLKSFCPLVITYDDLCFWSHQKLIGNLFVDIGEEIEDKLHALSIYKSQMREDPHERSFENIRNYHSVLGRSQGVKYAEQFYINRLFL
tara:strand:+ start:484 stop:1179 length:696 start_codon:yes stop_codon:yes gene_type:complete